MKFTDYKLQIAEWTKQYPFQPVIQPFDPTKDKASCVRCGSHRKLSRHHKGNDFWFALLRPDLYARDYIQFLPHQVVLLCDKCHKLVHTHYRRMMEQVKLSLNTEMLELASLKELPTKEWCDYWMNQFRTWFDKWIQKPYTKRKRRKRGSRLKKSGRKGFGAP